MAAMTELRPVAVAGWPSRSVGRETL